MAARKGIAAVVARRAEEDRIARVKDDIGASAKVLAMATFEARTGARIAKAATVAEAERARAALAEELRKRRNACVPRRRLRARVRGPTARLTP